MIYAFVDLFDKSVIKLLELKELKSHDDKKNALTCNFYYK
jgi:hypothetical protein